MTTQLNDLDLFYYETPAPSATTTSRADLLKVIEEAEAEKRARVENDPDKRIAQAQAELARQNAQQRQADLSADVQANEHYIRDNERAIQLFLQRLTLAIQELDQLTRPPFDVDTTFETQQRFVSNALGRFMAAGDTPDHLARLNSPDGMVRNDEESKTRREYLAAESRFNDGAPLWLALVGWINTAPTQGQRQLRVGITYAITRQLYDPDENWSYDAEKQRISAENRRRYSR